MAVMSSSHSQEKSYPTWMTKDEDSESLAVISKRDERADELLGRIHAGRFDFQTFNELGCIVDHESYFLENRKEETHQGRRRSVALKKAWTGKLVITLSDCLFTGSYPEVCPEREGQFRALFSALILQHVQESDGCHPAHYDKLQRQFQCLHQDLHRTKAPGVFNREKWSRHQCDYLLVIIAEYAKTFAREERLSWTVWKTISSTIFLGGYLALAATTGLSSPTLPESIQRLDQSLKQLCQSPQQQSGQLFSLFAVQEITRIIVAHDLHTRAIQAASNPDGGQPGEWPAQKLALCVLGRIQRLLGNGHNERDLRPPAGVLRDFLAMMSRDPPGYGDYHYVFGLLDCASQLGRVLQPELMPLDSLDLLVAFENRVRVVLDDAEEPSLRWKAIEFLLTTKAWTEAEDQKHEAEAVVIKNYLDEENGGSANFCRRPSSGTTRTSARASRDSLSLQGQVNFSRWKELSMEFPDIQLQVRSEPCRLPVKDKQYKCAGISPDCKSAFLMDAGAFVICNLESFRSNSKIGKGDLILSLKSSSKYQFEATRAAISNRFLTVAMTLEAKIKRRTVRENQLKIYDYGVSPPRELRAVNLPTSETPSCIAIRQSPSGQVWLAIGIYGEIKIYHYNSQDNIFEGKDASFSSGSSNYLETDTPKTIDFSEDGRQLICITEISNHVLVWQLSGEGLPQQAPFSRQKTYAPGTNARGIDSASLFKSPRGSLYMFCTTAPSAERQGNGGEWPFICPVPSSQSEIPLGFEHNFEKLERSKPILAGDISADGKIVAMLEDSGTLMLFPLTAELSGGVGPKGNPVYVDDTLAKNTDRPTSSTSLRFNTNSDGTLYLFAVDNRGKLIRTQVQGNP